MAIHHIAGVKVGEAETVHDIRTVICQLHHLASHVKMLIQPQSEAAAVLQRSKGSKSHFRVLFCFFSQLQYFVKCEIMRAR